MLVKQSRPVHLKLWTIKFPIMAIVSVLHRISGVFLFLALPFLLWLLDKSLASFGDFVEIQSYLTAPLIKFFLFVVLAGLLYHLFAGIRHLLMDAGIGESLSGGRKGSWWVMVVSIGIIGLVGLWIW
jgi:succinate dehydrogenase / fumarate reductase cytochrome b subunit